MEYTKLEQKILEEGRNNFRKELRAAFQPIARVLEKYEITDSHLLERIGIYSCSDLQYELQIPNGSILDCINDLLLENFMKEYESLLKLDLKKLPNK